MLKNLLICSIIALIIMLSVQVSYTQCSDAGICYLGQRYERKILGSPINSRLSLEYYFGMSGMAENSIYNSVTADGELSFLKNNSVSFKIPYMFMNSDSIGNVKGIGDVTFSVNRYIILNKTQYMCFQAGGKFATSSKEKFGYQNGYGTNDLLLGANYYYSFFNIGLGTQIPLSEYKTIGITFKRGSDLLIRGGYIRAIDKFSVKIEGVLIKRLSKSELKSGLLPEIFIKNSDFFQVNLTGGLTWQMNDKFSSKINFTIPLMKREDNSDGTKRSFTALAGINYRFGL